MNKHIKFLICESEINQRIDKFISLKLDKYSRSSIQKMINNNNILINGKKSKNNYKLKLNDILEIIIPEPKEINILPENILLDIIYEDNDLLVINKKKGMVVHPAAGNQSGTLVNALLFHCKNSLSGINGKIRPGIVHRIDKDTSGLLIVAKNDFSHNKLAKQIKDHSFKREYETIVYGNIKNDSGTINFPIGRHQIDRKKMSVIYKNSKTAITHYKVIKRYYKFTHLKLKLETGRTHQIRVHMSYIGYPVAGDHVYGPKKVIKELNGQCLHAKSIGFIHPRYEKYLEFESKLPSYFKTFLNQIC